MENTTQKAMETLMSTVTEELFRKKCAECEAYKDLAESAIVATARFQYGAACVGKVVSIRGYYYKIVSRDGILGANLIEVQP